ncbi:hypothetical protein, partial [uncultured Tessaracoccus sp.]|uniref:hypothetical protein n=1 Tax=uncultured Tessaracoccus sp. TaxID=905023 RepID=UPI00260C97B2
MIWQYSPKRAVRDGQTLTAQEHRTIDTIEGRSHHSGTKVVQLGSEDRWPNGRAASRIRRRVRRLPAEFGRNVLRERFE